MVDEFSVDLVQWQTHASELSKVRYIVFVVEQKVPEEIEIDTIDPKVIHALATDRSGLPIGTGRLSENGRIGRVAVLAGWRGKNVGTELMQTLIDHARIMGMKSVHLHGQTQSLAFYRKLGFEADGPEFSEAGIPHRNMTMAL